MNRMFLRRPTSTASDDLLAGLTQQQYLNPQQPLRDALSAAQQKIGFCPLAAEAAVKWLQTDDARPIGRLRRTELMQLARCIDRFWQQAQAAELGQAG
jgi:hypothetical protein